MNQSRLALGAIAADLLATAVLYHRLPATVPVHWGLHGADSFGPRWTMVALGPGLLSCLWLLLRGLARIDPLAARAAAAEEGAPPAEQGSFALLMASLIGLGALAHVALLLDLVGLLRLDTRLWMLLLPASLMLVGNFLPRVRPNYFAGLRTPWTLASASVWRRTNRLAGRLLFAAGLLLVPLALFARLEVFVGLFVALLLACSVAPIAASYLWWRAERGAGG